MFVCVGELSGGGIYTTVYMWKGIKELWYRGQCSCGPSDLCGRLSSPPLCVFHPVLPPQR